MDLQAFRARVGRDVRSAGRTQKELAATVGLHPHVLSHKLHGRARLTHGEVKAVVKTLAAWQAITTRAEAGELLQAAGLPPSIFCPEEWARPPLSSLEGQTGWPRPAAVAMGHRQAVAAVAASRAVLAPPPAPGGAFPLPATPLVGRTSEVDHVVAQLRGGARLVTLTGPGGTGKTRLALAAAARLRDAGIYPDGAVFVDLAPVREPAHVPAALAATLGVAEAPGHPLPDRLIEALRDTGLLLVLDNCEHVLGAAPLVATLLGACRRLQVLATSRLALRLSAEEEYRVPPLGLPPPAGAPAGPGLGALADLGPDGVAPAADGVAAVLGSEAGELFVRRARAARADFALTVADAPAVAALCRRLDGLPLAIELAAARVRAFSPRQLLERMGEGLALLTGGARDLPARQQTLRATLDWSHALLAPAERRLFARLSVFAGGCDLSAAEAVCGPDLPGDVLDALQALVSHGLLESTPEPEGGRRFRMLETVGEYARARLAEGGEAAPVLRRHAQWYQALVEPAGPEEPDTRPRREARMARLEREYANLQAALAWCAEHDPAAGLRLAGKLSSYWNRRACYAEERRWLATLLERAPEGGAARAGALCRAAGRALDCWDLAEAHARVAEALPLCRALGDPHFLARALREAGKLHTFAGEPAAARPPLVEALTLARGVGDRDGVADALLLLGVAARDADTLLEARALLAAALEEARVGGNPGRISLALRLLGSVALRLGHTAEAERLLTEALELAQAQAAPAAVTRVEDYLGRAASARGDPDGAAAWHAAGLALARETEDAWALTLHLTGLGRAAHAKGDLGRATALLEEALARATTLCDRRTAAGCRHALALVACDGGDAARAGALLRESLAARRELGDGEGVAACLEDLAAVEGATRGQA
ncbi:MAG TPA: AAA family ATPase, partial [Chloroflexota bacterium]|nr:AAA family ATPase [Chloroflexota bacterium]